ncbi:MAG: ATP-binding cassette domain-containing protein [Candidatus Zixiibacteriota bacterium]
MQQVHHDVLVELSNVFLTSDRGEEVFEDLCFKLNTRRSAVITGPAGSGKTTLVELLIGRRWAQSGFVEVMGEVLKPGQSKAVRRVRRRIGGVGGIFGLMPSLTVAENIIFPLILSGERRKVRRERLLKVLGEFSLLKQGAEYPNSLTRVERTLVQFARASIAHQPLMVIDEPLAGLDRKTYQRILDYLVSASLAGRSMIILASDDLEEQLPNTDYYQIAGGKLV